MGLSVLIHTRNIFMSILMASVMCYILVCMRKMFLNIVSFVYTLSELCRPLSNIGIQAHNTVEHTYANTGA